MNAASNKAALRRELVARRLASPAKERSAREAQIVAHVAAHVRAHQSRTLGLYLPVKGEVDLTSLRRACPEVPLALPVVAAAGRIMHFHRWDDMTPLVANRFGILEPQGGARINLTKRDVLLVPCVALALTGVRLGYGGGFYDAYLATTEAEALGVVLEEFLVESLPFEPHDRRLAWAVTERGIRSLGP